MDNKVSGKTRAYQTQRQLEMIMVQNKAKQNNKNNENNQMNNLKKYFSKEKR